LVLAISLLQLEDCLQEERNAAEQLRADLHRTESRVEELEQEKQFENERIVRLEEHLRNRDEEVTKYTQRFIAGEGAVEHLREEMSRFKREQERILSEQARLLSDALRQKDIMERNLEEVVRSKVDVDLELRGSKEREGKLLGEVEDLKREVKTVKMDSADKEVKIVQIMKRSEREREDLVGLGIALESKQQELELVSLAFSFS
jgi:chromosome segregation ATPase